eukprot:4431212-Pleurochrysis_carterae.AAC.4
MLRSHIPEHYVAVRSHNDTLDDIDLRCRSIKFAVLSRMSIVQLVALKMHSKPIHSQTTALNVNLMIEAWLSAKKAQAGSVHMSMAMQIYIFASAG